MENAILEHVYAFGTGLLSNPASLFVLPYVSVFLVRLVICHFSIVISHRGSWLDWSHTRLVWWKLCVRLKCRRE